DAQKLLADIIANKRIRLRGVTALWPAQAIGDDVAVYAPEALTGNTAGTAATGNNESTANGSASVANADAFTIAANAQPLGTFRFLRQQKKKLKEDEPYLCLADYIAPQSSGRTDF